jgi:hypothetical protein
MNYRPDPLPGILARIKNLEACQNELAGNLTELKMTVNHLLIPQTDRISELAAWSDPYARSGQALCNYYDGMDEDD